MNIKSNLRRLSALLLVLLLSLLPVASTQAAENPAAPVRIGLYWGGDAMPAANLLNETGSGYRFGYYDETRSFVPLAETEETAITMLKDWTMYLSGGAFRDELPAAGVEFETLGCYHIRLGSYEDVAAARAAAGNYADGFVAWLDGRFYACAGSYTSLVRAQEANASRGLGGTAATGSDRCVTVVASGSTRILFQFDGGKALSLGVQPRDSEDGQARTWFRNRQYYGGFQYTREDGGDLTVVNFLEMDDYIRGVIPYEMSPAWPLEALKAQAIAARTYAAAHLNSHRSHGFDLCGTVCCQTYQGARGATEQSDRAVLETSGQYLTYEGEYVNAFYHSCDGGATENCENVFYDEIPYLRGVQDPYEAMVETGFERWSFVYTADEITAILREKGYACGRILSVTPTYTALGNILSLRFTDDAGKNWVFSKDRAGSILYSSTHQKYTYSQRFTVEAADGQQTELFINSPAGIVTDPAGLCVVDGRGVVSELMQTGEITVLSAAGEAHVALGGSGAAITADRYRITGSGWGHNVGMSQYGAKAMAELGFSCEEILSFYYQGVDIG